MNILENLNKNQTEAVKTTEGYVRVIAGPGSGKTMTIAHRYAYLVNDLGISPSNILCLTFTNKAAKEMKNRIEKLIKSEVVGDFVCTFHSFCLKFLREEIYHLNLPKNFSIMDGEDRLELLKEIYPELKLSPRERKYSDAEREIAFAKISYPDYVYYFDDKAQNKPTYWSRIFSAFVTKQRKYNMLEFEDLIYFTIHILENHPDVLKKWSERISYVMIDEAQDNNKNQWAIANLMSRLNKNLFVVGDPDQAIYEWRGATPHELVSFDTSHSPCTDIVLNDNYRSLEFILEASNTLIKNNKNRVDKEMKGHRSGDSSVYWHHAPDIQEEVTWTANHIKKLKKQGEKYRDIAILYRNSYSSRNIEQALLKQDIPYIVYGGVRFFERQEIKDTIAYMRLIEYGDDFSFLRIFNSPKRGLGNKFKKDLMNEAEKCGKSLFDTLCDNLHTPELGKEGAKQLCKFVKECRDMKDVFSISDLLEYVIDESGIRKTLKEDGDEERMENLKELVSSSKLYEEEHSDETISLVSYLQEIALYTNLDYKKDGDSVSIMTIHQSKGLEFKYVFIHGLTEGVLPSWRSISEKGILGSEEERRLMYVAMTRAKDCLFMTDSVGYDSNLNTNKIPSRFIPETEKYIMTDKSIPVDKDSLNYEIYYNKEKTEYDYSEKYEVNAEVTHQVFGKGIVREVTDYGYYIIEFSVGKRKISFSYEGLE